MVRAGKQGRKAARVVKGRKVGSRQARAIGGKGAGEFGEAVLAEWLGRAHATGAFAGNEPASFVEGEQGAVVSASVAVIRRAPGHDWRFVGVADFAEFNTGSAAWKKRPRHELARVAMILALQYAFTEAPPEPFPDVPLDSMPDEELLQEAGALGEAVKAAARKVGGT